MKPGIREHKRRETHQRIVDAGLKLFAAQGYEATTLAAIAAEAGISRRTFFHYFKSKDDILLSLQAGLGEQLVAALDAVDRDRRPLDALREAMLSIAGGYSLDDLIAIDKLMLTSEAVQARKQAGYVRDEATLFAALRERWPQENEMNLRILALIGIGLTRVTLNAWRSEGAKRPISALLGEAFAALTEEFSRR